MQKEGKNMSETKAKTLDMEELVDFTAPMDPTGVKRDILLAVNGESVRIQRGASVRIKRKFLEVWNNASAQAMAARATMEKAQKGNLA